MMKAIFSSSTARLLLVLIGGAELVPSARRLCFGDCGFESDLDRRWEGMDRLWVGLGGQSVGLFGCARVGFTFSSSFSRRKKKFLDHMMCDKQVSGSDQGLCLSDSGTARSL
jgi:hypothetical protein